MNNTYPNEIDMSNPYNRGLINQVIKNLHESNDINEDIVRSLLQDADTSKALSLIEMNAAVKTVMNVLSSSAKM